jgi:hypothetical protein
MKATRKLRTASGKGLFVIHCLVPGGSLTTRDFIATSLTQGIYLENRRGGFAAK